MLNKTLEQYELTAIGIGSVIGCGIFFLIFLLMIFLAVIILRIKQPDRERSFIIPFNVFNIPILVVFGIIISLGFIIFVGCSTKHIGINI